MTNETPAKKGLSTWAWVAIGCGGLLVVCLIAFLALGAFVFQKGKEAVQEATGAESLQEMVENLQDNPVKVAAEMAVRMNPDLELVSSDEAAGTITVRDTRSGEAMTLDFEDMAEGRFSMTTSEGEFSMDASGGGNGGVTFKGPEGETRIGAGADLSGLPEGVPLYPGAGDVQHAFQSTNANERSGAVTSKTSDDAQTVMDYFEETFESEGYAITSKSMTSSADGAYGAIGGELKAKGRTINVVIIEQKGESQIMINYSLKKTG